MSTLTFVESACDFCNGTRSRPVFDFTVCAQKVALVQCDSCGLKYLRPRPSSDALPRFYGSSYYSYQPAGEQQADRSFMGRLKCTVMKRKFGYDSPSDIVPLPIPGVLARLIAGFVAVPTFRPAGRLLDVGCGSGDKLLWFRGLGWDVTGFEFSEQAANAGRQCGLDIRLGADLRDAEFPAHNFDAVTLYHSLEHMISPRETLNEVHRVLKPGGELLVCVPNIGSLEARIFGRDWGWIQVPIHLFHFDRGTLRRYVERAGFRVLSIGTSHVGKSIGRGPSGALWPVGYLVAKFASPFAVASALIGSGKALVVKAEKI